MDRETQDLIVHLTLAGTATVLGILFCVGALLSWRSANKRTEASLIA